MILQLLAAAALEPMYAAVNPIGRPYKDAEKLGPIGPNLPDERKSTARAGKVVGACDRKSDQDSATTLPDRGSSYVLARLKRDDPELTGSGRRLPHHPEQPTAGGWFQPSISGGGL